MEASQAEKNTFGVDVKLHPITRMPLEQGIGHRPAHEQAQHHCNLIEHQHGKEAADKMRRHLADADQIATATADMEQ